MKNPEKLLDLLAQDARLTSAQLAAMLGESEEDVAAAIKAYEKNSTILGYKTVVDWDKTSKESVTALIEVKITPQKGMGFDEIARQIYSHHQVESVYLMSGGFDLTVIIKGRTMREVARFVSEQLAPMENVLSTGTHFILKKYKDNSVEFDAFLNWRLKCRTRSRSVWASRILKRRGRSAAPAFSLWKKDRPSTPPTGVLPSCAIRLPRSCAASTACATMRTRRSL